MRHMMKRMGIAQQDIDATEVIIRCSDKNIIISNPQVAKVNMMGQETYQVVGEAHEESLDTAPELNEEDIKTVMDQTGASVERVREVLETTKGDLAEAILKLKED